MNADPERLLAIARPVRRFLETIWPRWHVSRGEAADRGSRGTCGRSSLFLARVLREDFALPAAWRSGAPGGAGGGFLGEGGWHGHAWVEAGDWIVDVTADQFGVAPVLVVARDDTRYAAASEDAALPRFRRLRAEAVEALWPLWRPSEIRAELLAEAPPCRERA